MRNIFEHINNELIADFGSMVYLGNMAYTPNKKINVLKLKGSFEPVTIDGVTIRFDNLDDVCEVVMCPYSGHFYLVSTKGFVFLLVRKTFKQKLLAYFKNKS